MKAGAGKWGRGTERAWLRLLPWVLACSVPCPPSPVPALLAQDRSEQAPEPFTIAGILSAPIPTELVGAPNGRAVAWLADEQGRKNVWVAEAPAWRARRLTRWLADDGQELSELTWTADSRFLLVVRGGDPGGNYDEHLPANPTSDPRGTDQSVWVTALRGGVPRRIGEGYHPAPSPRGDRVVWILRDTLRTAPIAMAGAPQILFKARGHSRDQAFAPDGRTLAFTSDRGSHSFIGLYDFAARAVRWVSPGTFSDVMPRWSPDGEQLAFIRLPGETYDRSDPVPPLATATAWTAYAVRVADPGTLASREIWRSPTNSDGGFPGPAGDWALLFGGGNRILFASEQTGWIGLYSINADGGEATRLTPAGCEIYDVTLDRERQNAYYASNCDDIERRHIQTVSVTGGAPAELTTGTGIEWGPQPLSDTLVAVLRSNAQDPAAPAFTGTPVHPLEGWAPPDSFPAGQLVEPTAVVVRAADSTEIHLDVFVPPGGNGRYPAVIHFHGGPQRQMLLGWHYRPYYHRNYAFNQYLASRGFIVVSVNYRGGVGYGRAFRQAPGRGRNGASEYHDALAAAAWLRARHDVDTTRIGLWGGSYGGYLTALGLARNSDLFAAGFDLHGVHDYATESGATEQLGVSDSALAAMRKASAVGDVTHWRSPVLLVQGDDDRNVQFQQTVDLAQRLRRQGVRVEELVFPDDIHDFLRFANWVEAYRRGAHFLVETLRTASATGR